MKKIANRVEIACARQAHRELTEFIRRNKKPKKPEKGDNHGSADHAYFPEAPSPK